MLAAYFGSDHEQSSVLMFNDVFRVQWASKARPASARMKFMYGAEEGFSGNNIDIDAGLLIVPVGIIKWGFSAVLADYPVLQGCQLLL